VFFFRLMSLPKLVQRQAAARLLVPDRKRGRRVRAPVSRPYSCGTNSTVAERLIARPLALVISPICATEMGSRRYQRTHDMIMSPG
jgi:hypothetical protein